MTLRAGFELVFKANISLLFKKNNRVLYIIEKVHNNTYNFYSINLYSALLLNSYLANVKISTICSEL